jgi:hypothetical protein
MMYGGCCLKELRTLLFCSGGALQATQNVYPTGATNRARAKGRGAGQHYRRGPKAAQAVGTITPSLIVSGWNHATPKKLQVFMYCSWRHDEPDRDYRAVSLVSIIMLL